MKELDDAALNYLMSRPIYTELLNKPSVKQELLTRMIQIRGPDHANKTAQSLDRTTLVSAAAMIEGALSAFHAQSKRVQGDVIQWAVKERTFPLQKIFKAMNIINRLSIVPSDDVFLEVKTLSALFHVLYSGKQIADAANAAVRCFFGESMDVIMNEWKSSKNPQRTRTRRAVDLFLRFVKDCDNRKDKLIAGTILVEKTVPIKELIRKLKLFCSKHRNAAEQWARVLHSVSRAESPARRDGPGMEEFRGTQLFSASERRQAKAVRKRLVRKKREGSDEHSYERGGDFQNVFSGDNDTPRRSPRFASGSKRRRYLETAEDGTDDDQNEGTANGSVTPRRSSRVASKRRRTRRNEEQEDEGDEVNVDPAEEEIDRSKLDSNVLQRVEELEEARRGLQDTVGEDVLPEVVNRSRKARQMQSGSARREHAGRSPSPFTDDDRDNLGPRPALPEVEHRNFPNTIREAAPSARRGKGVRFTSADDEELHKGLKKYGYGQWKKIHSRGKFSAGVNNAKLKDRARYLRLQAKDFPLPAGTKKGRGRPNKNLRIQGDSDESNGEEHNDEIENPDSEPSNTAQ